MRSFGWVLVVLAALSVMPPALARAAEKPPGSVLATIPLPFQTPTGLAWDGARLWVADYDGATLCAVDPTTGKVVGKLEAPGYAPMGLAWDGQRLWCLDAEDKTAYALDVAQKRTLRALPLDTATPEGLGWDGTALWVADAGAGLLTRLDQQDGTTYRSFPCPTAHSGKRAQEVGIAWDGKWLWVSDRGTDRIYQVEPKTGWVINFFDSPAPYPTGLAWDGQRLWCADYETHALYALAAKSAVPFVTFSPKRERVVYTEQWRNFGPGTATTLDIYLAIPRDLPNQALAGEPVFDPRPTDFPSDQWGQRFAHFAVKDLAAGREFVARMTTDVTVKRVRWFVDPDAVGGLDQVPAEIREAYLVDESKLVIRDPVIQKAVQEAVGDEKHPYWIAQRIYRYIMKKMFYELSGGWNVAPVVLERGSGSCSEYTFVMISMCRAAGLPARYAGSIVVRGDDASRDDVFHRWVEVYLPNYGWVCVDPSGGDSDVPEAQAGMFGGLDNRFLITTLGGGNSTYLGWDYNSNAFWTGEGRLKLMQRKAGEWFPVGKKYEPRAVGEPGDTTGR